MGDEIEFTKLPLEECCTHKLWKARLHGYTEAGKLFKGADDEKAPVFNQYIALISKFAGDSNAVAQEKGLEAVLLFVQNAAIAGKTVKDVMSVIVSKAIAAPKAKTKDLSLQITLTYIEIERQEQVIEELVKGLEHKNPKIVAACVSAITQSLREFGSKVIGVKPFIKFIGPLLEDRDKTVRDEGKAMVVEIFRWIKDAIKPQLTSLKPVHVTELEVEFEKIRGEKAVPTRVLRSQQEQQAKLATQREESGGACESAEAGDEGGTVDPYDLMDPLNILSQIPNDFYEKIEAKKWQERKEAIDGLEKLLEYPKLERGDYGELVRALLKIISKDSNVMIVGVAVKCIGKLALGLKKGFQPYAGTVLPNLLEKFKEKKANVVAPLREAVDAVYPVTTLESIQEDLLSSLDNKNPAVKAETASFLARCFTKCTPTILNKKLLKTFTTALLKTLNESDPTVRDNSAEALGTAMKVVGEKVITQFMPDVDNIKLNKIKECCEKAVVVKAQPVVSKPTQVAAKAERSKSETSTVKLPGKAANVPKKVSSVSSVKKVPPSSSRSPKQVERDRELTDEEVEEKILEILPEDIVKGIGDSAWKVRLESTESFLNTLKSVEEKDVVAQVLIKTLARKPGLKDTNFQVLRLKLEALKSIIERFSVTSTVVDTVLMDIVDKLGDPKNGALAAELLTSLSEATDLGMIARQTLDYAFSQKSPKVQQESLNWVAEAVKDFGGSVQIKLLIDNIKKGLNATNAAVRSSSISLCGVLYMFFGNQLSVLLDEKPAVMALLNAEFEKHDGEKPPSSVRGTRKSNDTLNSEDSAEEKVEEKVSETVSRVDISPKLTDQLISELGDKNWKTRNEALNTLSSIISDAKSIKSNLGELPTVLCQRLVDSNGKLALLALDICKAIALAMGSQCKIHIKTFFRGFLSALGDSKQWVRSAALACINTWGAEGGFKEYFEGEVIPDALKTGSPTLRTELWTWLAELLPNSKSLPKEEVVLCVPYLYTSLEDRNSDVRKSAQSAVLPIMIHVGYGNMVKQTEKLTPGSKSKVVAVLEKLRPEMPVQAEPVKTAAKSRKVEEKAKADVKMTPKVKGSATAVKSYSRKKEEEVDLTPLLPVNNMKNQRLIDEQKLKTLKWNFTIPRSEFVDLLREQMTAAGLNKTLIVNMFHADFKFHLRAIESLSEDVGNAEALISNLDLILKWMTLRFFDTNPSVLLKGLEYLQNVFSVLIDNDYTVFDIEANSFIPYLVIKLGDPKDAVRDRVRAIIKQLSQMYPPGKLFSLIMEGLKSKNARQRAECLEELGNLIEEFGMSVCQPTPSNTLKEISKQISDRDNAVRSAALNAIVKAWFIEGDKVYKLIGQLSEKDMSLLEERIKRASKGRPPVPVQSRVEVKEKEKSPDKHSFVQSAPEEPDEEPDEPITTATPKQRQSTFGANLFKELDLVEPPMQKIELIEIDDSFLEAPITIPERIAAKLNKNLPPPSFQAKDLLIEQVIREVGSPNINVAFQAATKLRLIFASGERSTATMLTDSIMDSFITQLKLVNSYSLEKYGLILQKTYAILFRIIDDIFGKKTAMAEAIKVNHLQMLVQELLITLIEDKTAKFAEGGCNRLINAFVTRIIENADHTSITCAMIKSLFDVVANPPSNPKITNFTTKCFIKIIILIRQGNSNWLGSLDLDEVLYECHLFFQAYPRHTWKDRPSQGPQKAIKTLLLVLVGLKGKSIFSHLKKIENPCSSELSMFLKRLLKIQPHVKSSTNNRLSKAMSEHLSDIFMKIANEETAKEGLLQFYEFKKQNPNLDLSSFLAPTSKYFQDYVENGLRNIEKERGLLRTSEKKIGEPAPAAAPEDVCAADPSGDGSTVSGARMAQYYLDKLRAFQARVGIHISDLPDFKSENQS